MMILRLMILRRASGLDGRDASEIRWSQPRSLEDDELYVLTIFQYRAF